MRAQCDHCGEVNDHVRPTRVALKIQIVCRDCRIELGIPDQDDLQEDDPLQADAREVIDYGS